MTPNPNPSPELRTSISPQAFNDLPDYIRSYITHLETKAQAAQPAELLGLKCDANNGGMHEAMMSGKEPFCPKCGLMLRRHAYTLPHVKPAQFAAALSPQTLPAPGEVERLREALAKAKQAARYVAVGDGYYDPYASRIEAVDAVVDAALSSSVSPEKPLGGK